MHHKSNRRTLREFLFAGRRKYLVAFVGLFAAGALGLASASWFTVPATGHGNAYGKGQNQTAGVALASIDYSSDGTCGGVNTQALGPNASGFLCFGLTNSNNFAVTLTNVSPTSAAKIVAAGAPSCTATPGSDFTIGAWTGGPQTVPAATDSTHPGQAFGSGDELPITTTGTFPSCLAGVTFSLATDLAEMPAT